jgi:hypothetical protein
VRAGLAEPNLYGVVRAALTRARAAALRGLLADSDVLADYVDIDALRASIPDADHADDEQRAALLRLSLLAAWLRRVDRRVSVRPGRI